MIRAKFKAWFLILKRILICSKTRLPTSTSPSTAGWRSQCLFWSPTQTQWVYLTHRKWWWTQHQIQGASSWQKWWILSIWTLSTRCTNTVRVNRITSFTWNRSTNKNSKRKSSKNRLRNRFSQNWQLISVWINHFPMSFWSLNWEKKRLQSRLIPWILWAISMDWTSSSGMKS